MRHRLPFAPPGASVGLFGGSFDPAHAGHLALSRAAMRRLRLDRIWWLVSPGNPLKPHGPAALDRRLARAQALLDGHPRVQATDIEQQLGTRYTADTLVRLRRLYPHLRPVWLMGADGLRDLHRWQDWRSIIESVPIAVFARPGQRLAALGSVAARSYAGARLPARLAPTLAQRRAPRWCFIDMPMVPISSTELRRTGQESDRLSPHR
ncbi:nicotinate-nucleotide adenylyltransferase [Rhodobacteraceae bacterium 2376]|uniref:Probable nicotinate-nucleotide adenylyltransferase n=1 Tax=Rhabdonatronobacter sediminivivens TaxID=2743469 RepID=A0A7Z0HXU5_9RHOB|nr:nicotinate-nucleotide adenylyltransferase [Rhabdonatronobacter sediminivivens]NYS23849.1 nicotinate-nucleotide adenylyltransferase [Rhabdonatronobacter sediminivivens]